MLCVYCGKAEATTEDHVIPEGFFVQAPPEEYILVPACEPCNNGHSKDEEYFLSLLLGPATELSGDANAILTRWSKDHNSGKRRRAGLARRLVDAVAPVDAYSHGGIYLGKRLGVRIEVDRVNRVLEKIARGLFFHEFGRRLPDDLTVYVEAQPDPERLRSGPFPSTLAQKPKRLGDVFAWSVVAVEGQPDFTAWVMAFYDGSVFAIAATGRLKSPA